MSTEQLKEILLQMILLWCFKWASGRAPYLLISCEAVLASRAI